MESKTASYQVIPRKYRPQTFASVIGQKAIVTTLKNALRFQRLAHAYLFSGSRGTGKTTLARVFAKALNCQQLNEAQEPCNACPSCLEVISGRSLDVLEIDGASNRGIDDIRQINETIGYAPASGKFKIYIIDEVHMLTKEAFNALLKTLEEPPPNVKFFFATTEPHKVLPTIISRCQRFDLNRITPDAMQKKLAWIAEDLGVQCEPEALALISHITEGALRDAESLLDQVICYAEPPITLEKVSATLGLMPRTAFFSLDKAIAEENLSFAFELAQTIFSSGRDLGYFLDSLVEHFRTLLHFKLGRSPNVIQAQERAQYTASAAHYSEEQCLSILDYLVQWQQQIAKTPFKRVSLEMILLHLVRSKNRISLSALVERLVELEQAIGSPGPLIPPKTPPREAPSAVSAVEKELPAPQLKEQAPPIPQKEELPAPQIEEQATETQAPRTPLVEPQHPAREKFSLEEALLKKVKGKIEEKASATASDPLPPASPPPAAEKQTLAPIQEQKQNKPPSPGRYETLIRFAAVELEGIVKRES